MLIREADKSNAVGIARAQVDAWQTAYKGIVPDDYLASYTYEKRAERWRQILASQENQENYFPFVAEIKEKRIVGFASAGDVEESIEGFAGELIAIYLLENYQRRGIGKLLVKAIVERFLQQQTTSMLVWVLADNPFRAFYERLGGEVVSEKQIEIGGASLIAVSYGWKNLDVLLER
ncbi:MAG: GNAT family N-acetyltransferase [Acidobacteriota bacterium]|nr:GNAT family N-acetyltransferase [Acidobacteriota bacterium]